jgi:hypothetical protein
MTMRRLSSLRVELPLRRLIGVSMLLGFSWLHAQCVPQAPDIVVTGTPLGPSGAYLWGQQVGIDVATGSQYSGESYRIEYSLNGGSWTTAASNVTSFPVTISLPAFTPPNYEGTLDIRAVAVCNSTNQQNQGSSISIALSDRLGNRPTIPIPITLQLAGAAWRATISDSTNGLATSNEYNASTGARWGSRSRDLFFVLTLPECLDSLVVNTCSRNTNFDTRIHLINANTNDTITNDDQGPSCTSAGGSVNANWLSQLVVFGRPNALRVTQTVQDDIGYGGSAKVVRDTALLVSGHTLYIVVEGSLSNDQGKFELTITGYRILPYINLTGAPLGPVCINSGLITLDATTPGATAYEWLDANGYTIATGPTYTFDPNSEGIFNVTAKVIFNPNEDPDCDYFFTETVTITVEDIAQAQIADASNTVVSGQTLSITEGSDVTLNVFSTQTFGNSYTWKLYNSIPPSGTPTISTGSSLTISNISAGDYTVILEAVRGMGACGTTQDIVYLNVTTGLRTDAGPFSIFPNPNTGAFTIAAPAMDTYRVQVLDVAGHLVAEDAFTGSTHQMRVSLPAGIYQVRLITGEKVQVERLIITE